MIQGKRVVLVLPAYNAESTLRKTCAEVPEGLADDILLVDDASRDRTVEEARRMGLRTFVHPENRGYGANQKTCYHQALELGADIVVMLHPDYQYTPKLLPSLVWPIAQGLYDCMLGSRILGVGALSGGMPLYKYASNRFLTLVQNLCLGYKLSEYHTGYRAFSRQVIEALPLADNDDDFIFDNQMLAQIILAGFRVGEVSCPTRYDADSSSINFRRSLEYGLGVLKVSGQGLMHRTGLRPSSLFAARGDGGAMAAPPGERG